MADDLDGFSTGNWDLEGTIFTSIEDGEKSTAEVVEFTGSQLKLTVIVDEI